jgi:hypothetical protein
MDLQEFNQQVTELTLTAQQFPGIELIWDKKMMKLYLVQGIEWEFRAVFSFAFNSPVLYFRPRNEWMGLDQLLEFVVAGVKGYVSQAECPVTGEPFFFIHPCGTKELLQDGNFATWISVALQVVNARLPIELFKVLSESKVKSKEG